MLGKLTCCKYRTYQEHVHVSRVLLKLNNMPLLRQGLDSLLSLDRT